MFMALRLTTLLSVLLIGLNSHALFEIRGGYGLLKPGTEKQNSMTVEPLSGFHGDVIVSPPMFPIGLGLRYESLNFKSSNPILGNIDTSYKRTSAIINYRFIDTVVFAGLIGTVSLMNDYQTKTTTGGVTTTTKYDKGTTFSVGAEGGANLLIFLVGLEAGYTFGTLSSASGAKMNTNGIYGKAHIGFGF